VMEEKRAHPFVSQKMSRSELWHCTDESGKTQHSIVHEEAHVLFQSSETNSRRLWGGPYYIDGGLGSRERGFDIRAGVPNFLFEEDQVDTSLEGP